MLPDGRRHEDHDRRPGEGFDFPEEVARDEADGAGEREREGAFAAGAQITTNADDERHRDRDDEQGKVLRLGDHKSDAERGEGLRPGAEARGADGAGEDWEHRGEEGRAGWPVLRRMPMMVVVPAASFMGVLGVRSMLQTGGVGACGLRGVRGKARSYVHEAHHERTRLLLQLCCSCDAKSTSRA